MAYSVLGGEILRMHHHQHVDVLVDVIEVGGERAHREQLLDLGEHRPGVAHLAGHRVELALHAGASSSGR